MSEKPQDWDRSRDEIISGEYVLGVLSEDDRKRVEARIASDPKFAQQVRRWQENLADFNDEYQEMHPSPVVYSRIEQRIFGDLSDMRSAGIMRSMWGSVSFWRALAATAVLAAGGILVAEHLDLSASRGPQRPLVAELTGMDSPMSLVATYDFSSGKLSVAPAALRQDQPKSLEVWLIEDGQQPVSLGVLPEDGHGDLVVSAGLRDAFAEGKTIAITVEPLGGAPEGKATGPVIAFGKTRLM